MTFEHYKERKRIDELDGLRAIAVLLVITVHMHDRVWDRLNGSLGVIIFFVLSGYLITMLALREEKARGRLDFAAFYIRRACRIFPLYYLVLAVHIVLIFGLKMFSDKAQMFARTLPYYLAYFQEVPFFRGPPQWLSFPFYQSWSLGIEEKFYLIWPLIAFGALAFSKAPRVIVTVIIILFLILSPVLFPSIRWYALEYYAHILMGALLALILENREGFAFMQRLGEVGLAIVLLVFIPLHFSRLQADHNSYAGSAYAVVFTILLGILLITEGRIQRFLSNRFLGFVGELSYGIYLVHILCLNAAEKVFPPGKGLAVPAYVLACLISIMVAYVLHRTLEKPMIHLGRTFSERLLKKRYLVIATP
jgi:peptidoglycan/LPS O-acetylase OafA/YrhL